MSGVDSPHHHVRSGSSAVAITSPSISTSPRRYASANASPLGGSSRWATASGPLTTTRDRAPLVRASARACQHDLERVAIRDGPVHDVDDGRRDGPPARRRVRCGCDRGRALRSAVDGRRRGGPPAVGRWRPRGDLGLDARVDGTHGAHGAPPSTRPTTGRALPRPVAGRRPGHHPPKSRKTPALTLRPLIPII